MLLTFEESALLSELEARPTLADLSEKLRKDPSVISRDLKKISEKAPVVEKINGRWVLTELGTHMAIWAKKVATEQDEILRRTTTLTIATTREFASRILANNFEGFLDSNVRFKIISCEEGVEESILKGIADIGLDCGRPHDPGIAFKQVIEEKIITVASVGFIKSKKIKDISQCNEEDFLHYTRLNPLQGKNIDVKKAMIASNDIAVLRNLLKKDLGWSTLPYYAVKDEIDKKEMSIIKDGEVKGYKFGVWWLRGRDSLQDRVKKAEIWLGKQKLDF
jgi:DNA-binding transcriptional LysR family regulator